MSARRALLLAACASVSVAGAWGQLRSPSQVAATTATTAQDRIAGRVVSAMDGHGLSKATVVIAETRNEHVVQTVMTDADGAFAMSGVARGKYSLQGSAPGYLTSSYDEHEQFSTAIVTGAGFATEALVLRLPPVAEMSGHVTDETGEPVRGATVTLYRETHGEGRTRVTQFRNAIADDLGAYEIGELSPGNYFVSAAAVPWYAVHPPVRTGAEERAPVESIDPALNVAYPTTFYPGATDADGATPLSLAAGSRVNADLRLMPQPTLRLTLHLGPGAQTRAMPQLARKVFDDFEPIGGNLQIVGSDTEVADVAPGRYVLLQMSPSTGQIAKTTPLDLAGRAAEMDVSGGEEPGAVSVTIQDASGAKLPARMQISLMGRERGIAAGQMANEKGTAEFAGVKAGEYHLQLFGGDRAYHVLRLSVDGREMPDRTVHVSEGARLTVAATVTKGGVGVEGTAKRDGTPVAGAMIVLAPRDPEHNLEFFRRDQSDLDGTFLLPNVAPGTYTVLAIADGWTLEWGRAEVLTRYLGKGVPVTVPATGRTVVRLEEPVVVQAR